MKINELITKLQTVVLEPDVPVEPDTELLMSGLLDSLSVINLIAWIETEADISIDPADVIFENFERPSAIHRLIAGCS